VVQPKKENEDEEEQHPINWGRKISDLLKSIKFYRLNPKFIQIENLIPQVISASDTIELFKEL